MYEDVLKADADIIKVIVWHLLSVALSAVLSGNVLVNRNIITPIIHRRADPPLYESLPSAICLKFIRKFK